VEAPTSATSSGKAYLFNAWSETGVGRFFSFNTSATNKIFTATYIELPVGNGNGLLGLYYNTTSRTFTNSPTLVRTDPKVDFNWGTGSPSNGINGDFFTVRWIGEIEPPLSGNYTFFTESDDGVRLWVNDNLLVDKWIPQPATEWSGNINLTAGNRYPIKIEYFEEQGSASMKLRWAHANISKQIIPVSQLYSQLTTGNISSNEFQIFPTVVQDQLNIIGENTSWSIIDLMGRTHLVGDTSHSHEAIDVSSLASGPYLFKTNVGFVNKFIKL
jgi:hypothetical protein